MNELIPYNINYQVQYSIRILNRKCFFRIPTHLFFVCLFY